MNSSSTQFLPFLDNIETGFTSIHVELAPEKKGVFIKHVEYEVDSGVGKHNEWLMKICDCLL